MTDSILDSESFRLDLNCKGFSVRQILIPKARWILTWKEEQTMLAPREKLFVFCLKYSYLLVFVCIYHIGGKKYKCHILLFYVLSQYLFFKATSFWEAFQSPGSVLIRDGTRFYQYLYFDRGGRTKSYLYTSPNFL